MQNVLFNSVTRVYKEPIVKYLFTMLTIKSVKIWFKFKWHGKKNEGIHHFTCNENVIP